MLRLNLLPWREQRRAAAVRRFQRSLFGGAVAALALVLVIDQLAQARVRQQQVVNAAHHANGVALEQQVEQLDTVIEQRKQFEQRRAGLVRLHAGQGAVPGILAGLEQAAPAGLQLTRLHLKDGQVTLAGLAATPALVARLVREIQRLAVLQDVEVKQIRSSPAGDRFELVAKLPAHGS
ncbi:PilN domain-containing protein [Pseudomonas sp. RP23018S]|uniref:PilN domain-containing protein n=1 Tax=Pseudomonas sp. RP23018S TaxID=3096037 RepID=UPI002ACA8B1F|nr:PilN domain-containing protein [Pseudomonas sp. RP23018S]MDZ5603971.1 PilN domain-containing protein [Pseudomonas sp. RP23018S]